MTRPTKARRQSRKSLVHQREQLAYEITDALEHDEDDAPLRVQLNDVLGWLDKLGEPRPNVSPGQPEREPEREREPGSEPDEVFARWREETEQDQALEPVQWQADNEEAPGDADWL